MRFPIGDFRGDQLAAEFQQAGVPLTDWDFIFYSDVKELEIRNVGPHASVIQVVIAAHVPDPLYSDEDKRQVRIRQAKEKYGQMRWARLTPGEAMEWVDQYVVDFATAKVAISRLAGALVAIAGHGTIED